MAASAIDASATAARFQCLRPSWSEEPVDDDKLVAFKACHKAKLGAKGAVALIAIACAATITAGEAAVRDLGDNDK